MFLGTRIQQRISIELPVQTRVLCHRTSGKDIYGLKAQCNLVGTQEDTLTRKI